MELWVDGHKSARVKRKKTSTTEHLKLLIICLKHCGLNFFIAFKNYLSHRPQSLNFRKNIAILYLFKK